jgi:hypothetical protein
MVGWCPPSQLCDRIHVLEPGVNVIAVASKVGQRADIDLPGPSGGLLSDLSYCRCQVQGLRPWVWIYLLQLVSPTD